MRVTVFLLRYFLIPAYLLGAFGSEAAARTGVFNPETFTLGNGMQVVVLPNHRVPVITHMVWYKVGSADEPAGKSGIAHFLEHLMFKGTKNYAPGEFSRILARNGGRQNAFTSQDYTGYYQSVAADRLELVMKLEADRMTNLVLSSSDIKPERKVVLEERRQRTGNNPGSILQEQVQAAMFLNHPYRRPIIGWEHEVRALTRSDILSFYRRWYAPNNAVLVVAGDVTVEKLRPLAEKYYGRIPAVKLPPRARAKEPHHHAARRVVLRDSRVRQPSWSRSFLAPSYTAGAAGSAHALEVAAEILGGGVTSPLYKALVIDGKLAVSAGAHYDPGDMGPTTFTFHASPRPGVSMEKLEAAMTAEIAKIRDHGVRREDMERAKRRILAEAIYARDSLGAGARVLGAALASGRTVNDVESWPDKIKAVTLEQIKAAIRAVLREQQSVTALLLPNSAPKAPKG